MALYDESLKPAFTGGKISLLCATEKPFTSNAVVTLPDSVTSLSLVDLEPRRLPNLALEEIRAELERNGYPPADPRTDRARALVHGNRRPYALLEYLCKRRAEILEAPDFERGLQVLCDEFEKENPAGVRRFIRDFSFKRQVFNLNKWMKSWAILFKDLFAFFGRHKIATTLVTAAALVAKFWDGIVKLFGL